MNGKIVRFVKSNYLLFVGLAVAAALCWSNPLMGKLDPEYYRAEYYFITVAAVLCAVLQYCLNNQIFAGNRVKLRPGKESNHQWRTIFGSLRWTKAARTDEIFRVIFGIFWVINVWIYDFLAMASMIGLGLLNGIRCMLTEMMQGMTYFILYLDIVPYSFHIFHVLCAFLLTKAVLGFLLEPAPRKDAAPDPVQA